jgi:hypothetical protein
MQPAPKVAAGRGGWGFHLSPKRNRTLSARDVAVLLDAVAAVAEPVKLAFLWRPTLPDADDDMVLETAVNGRAEARLKHSTGVILAWRRYSSGCIRHLDFTPYWCIIAHDGKVEADLRFDSFQGGFP